MLKKKRKKIHVVSIIAIALVLSLGITFAALSYEKTGETQQLVLGDIWMKYGETNELSIENAMPSASYDSNKYFEFTISGKNTYEKKNIFYEIKLNHGDSHATRTERIRDDLLKFTLVEIKDNVETIVVDAASYNSLSNQRIWVNIVPANTLNEIETTYRLYMWVSSDTKIGNTADANYDVETWNEDVFASVKVNVTGDFNAKEIVGQDGMFSYIPLANGKIQIARYLGNATSLVIPAEYDEYEVYSVGNPDANQIVKAERYNILGATNSISNSTVTSVTFEEGIEVIDECAFNGCTGLTGTLHLPNSIKELGGFAFNGCSKLAGDLTLPDGLVKMGDGVFQSCSGLNGILTLPETLEEMGTSVFNHCSNLKNTTINIPASLRIIGREDGTSTHSFYNMAAKTFAEFTISEGNPYYKVVDGILYSVDGTRLVSYPQNLVFYDTDGNPTRTYEMPEGITRLDEMAFNRAGHASYSATGSTGLQKIVLANSFVLETTMPDCFLNTGNTLATALYAYTGVNEIAVKEDNPNYKTIDGVLYSKDGKEIWYIPTAKTGNIVISEGTEVIRDGTIFTGGGISSLSIPASVTTFENDMIERMNYYLKNKMTIDPNNQNYEIQNGIIVQKS